MVQHKTEVVGALQNCLHSLADISIGKEMVLGGKNWFPS